MSKSLQCAGRTCLSPTEYKPDMMMKHAIYRKSDIGADANCAHLLHPLFMKRINLMRHKSVYSYPHNRRYTAKIWDWATITPISGDGSMDWWKYDDVSVTRCSNVFNLEG